MNSTATIKYQLNNGIGILYSWNIYIYWVYLFSERVGIHWAQSLFNLLFQLFQFILSPAYKWYDLHCVLALKLSNTNSRMEVCKIVCKKEHTSENLHLNQRLPPEGAGQHCWSPLSVSHTRICYYNIFYKMVSHVFEI